MDIKILIACLVFLLLWRITISQQVSESKDPRMKKYHESHIDEMKKQSNLKNQQHGMNKKYIELGPVNLINKNIIPEKKTQSKVFRIKPTVPNQPKPFKFSFKSRDDLNFTYVGLNETNVTDKEPKEEEEVTSYSKDASVISIDESTPKEMDPQLRKKLINKSNKINQYNNTSPSKPAFFIDLPTSQNLFTTKFKITKPLVTEEKLPSTEKPNPENKQDDIQNDTLYVTDEAVFNKTEDTDSEKAQLYPMYNKLDKEQPKKHPFLDAIQNDRYLMCRPQDAPNASVIADTTSIEDIELRFRDDRLSESPKATPHQAVEMIIPDTDTEDEVEDVTIHSCTFEEISEISNTPRVTLNTEFNANNVPVPYKYNQVLKSIDLHNQLKPRTQDEQIIEKKDEKNVYIYNSYYQTPNSYLYRYNYQNPYKQNYQDGYCSYYQPTTPYNANYGNHASRGIPGIQNYWNKVYGSKRDVNRNSNANYGHNSAQPQQLQNYWYRDYDRTRGINERIHRKWVNTEYNIKGKNALKQFTTDNLSRSYDQSGPAQKGVGFI